MTQAARICILGGGFGGLYTALRLTQLDWTGHTPPEITLIDPRDRFVFLPLLYELLTEELETWEIAPTYADLLAHTPIKFVQAAVTQVDVKQQQVHVQDADTPIEYDRLVIAMGGETPMDLVPGTAEHAFAFRSVEDAYRVKARLKDLEDSTRDRIRVAVIGAGYSGIELACKLAERLGDRGLLRVVELGDRILRNSPEFNRQSAETALSDRSVWLDLNTGVERINPDSITLKYPDKTDTIPTDLVLWTVGTQVAPVVKSIEVPKTDRDRIKVTATLQVEDHPHIFALGDIADSRDVAGVILPTTAQAAFQQADYAGWNVWASLCDRPLLPLRYQNLGEMMTLGTDSATLSGLGIELKGLPAHLARRLIYLGRMPTLEHQIKVGLNWVTRPVAQLLTQLSRS